MEERIKSLKEEYNNQLKYLAQNRDQAKALKLLSDGLAQLSKGLKKVSKAMSENAIEHAKDRMVEHAKRAAEIKNKIEELKAEN